MHFIFKFLPYACLSCICLPLIHSAQAYEAKIVAHVDKRAITEKDLEDRISLIIFTSNQKNTPDTRNKMRKQVLDAMIFEQVKLKAAEEGKINFTEKDLKNAITDI
ncbi:MAG: SurA N-terminal domain-containing protein, partial [Alphaproteobacteria bacterium]|nr:SurA N-terminal domain-containing protein [Alphaproteobacteria bacterium]